MNVEKRMNVELLRRVQAQILAEPKHFDMGDWGDEGVEWLRANSHYTTNPTNPPCNTTACIGGWAVILDCMDKKQPIYDTDLMKGDEALGLSRVQMLRLFHDCHWPEKFRALLQEHDPGSPEYARVAADRIDHFIATGGRE